jgi:hypothetical protein
MVIIHPLKIAYQNVPKVGTTALFNWLYKIIIKRNKIKKPGNIRVWMKNTKNKFIENVPVTEFKKPEGYYVFCVTRDPVKRLLSAYSNRVLHFGELDIVGHKGHEIIDLNLAGHPSLNYFIENLEAYQSIKESVLHHTQPLVHFIGTDESIYDRIFDISEMHDLRLTLIKHWFDHGILSKEDDIPLIYKVQTSGVRFSLSDLTRKNFEKCLNIYDEDYKVFSALDKNKIELEWQQNHIQNSNDEVVGRAVVHIRPANKAVQINRLSIRKVNICKGELEPFVGWVVLNSDKDDIYRLIASDTRGEWQLEWKQPSPYLSKKYPNNPYASNSRFSAKGLQICPHHPVRIFIESEAGIRRLLFILEMDKS